MLRNLGTHVNKPAKFKCYSRCSKVLWTLVKSSLRNAIFGCVLALYFCPLVLGHPVFIWKLSWIFLFINESFTQGLLKGAILCFRNLYFYFRHGESTSTASQLTSPAIQKSKDLNKVLLLLQYIAFTYLPNINVMISFNLFKY